MRKQKGGRKPPSNKKQNSRPKKRTQRVRAKVSASSQLSTCAKHLLLAYTSPFDIAASGVCTPSFPARLTQRATVLKYGTFSTGVDKKGWMLFAPSVANDKASVYVSTVTSTGFNASISESDVLNFSNLPYASNQLWGNPTEAQFPEVRGRIVGIGVRLRCISPKMWISGRMYAYMHPQHANVNGYSIFNLGDKRECVRVPVSENWFEFPFIPVDNREFEFPDATIPATTTNGTYARAKASYLWPWGNGQSAIATPSGPYPYDYDNTSVPIGVILVAAPTTAEVPSLEFEFEIVVHAEYIGTPCDPVAIQAHSDPQGLGDVNGAANAAYASRAAGTDHTARRSTFEMLAENMATTADAMGSMSQSINRALGLGVAMGTAYRTLRVR